MKQQNEKSKLLIIIAILMILAIIIMIIINIVTSSKQETVPQENLTEEQIQEKNKEKLYDMDEYSRMKTYFNEYIGYIENKEYEKAYNLLYEPFRQTYYKTLEEYTQYVKSKYPYMISIEYNGVQRLGKYYVLDIIVKDIINATEKETPNFEQKFIIYEKDFDNFVLSFQAE